MRAEIEPGKEEEKMSPERNKGFERGENSFAVLRTCNKFGSRVSFLFILHCLFLISSFPFFLLAGTLSPITANLSVGPMT